jgi:hypothetical protein
MEGMGRWKSRTFSQILHIMSDDLTDYDGRNDDDGEDEGDGGGEEGERNSR